MEEATKDSQTRPLNAGENNNDQQVVVAYEAFGEHSPVKIHDDRNFSFDNGMRR